MNGEVEAYEKSKQILNSLTLEYQISKIAKRISREKRQIHIPSIKETYTNIIKTLTYYTNTTTEKEEEKKEKDIKIEKRETAILILRYIKQKLVKLKELLTQLPRETLYIPKTYSKKLTQLYTLILRVEEPKEEEGGMTFRRGKYTTQELKEDICRKLLQLKDMLEGGLTGRRDTTNAISIIDDIISQINDWEVKLYLQQEGIETYIAPRTAPKTLREAILKAFTNLKAPLTASQVKDYIEKVHGITTNINSVRRVLRELEEEGIIISVEGGGRKKLYIMPQTVEISKEAKAKAKTLAQLAEEHKRITEAPVPKPPSINLDRLEEVLNKLIKEEEEGGEE